jgi:hypothetical protein
MGISFSGGVIPIGTFKIKSNIPPVWVTAAGSLGSANGGQPYTFNLSATDPENAPLTYTVVGGSLPAGLGISGPQIIGTPINNPGTYQFTVRVFDGETAADRVFTIDVTNQTPIWTTAGGSLIDATENAAYSFSFEAADPNNDTVTYSISSGSLPAGLTLGSTGELSGTPTQLGISNFTVRATDTLGAFVDRAFSINVASAGDPYWTGVTLLMHMNGNFTDQKGHTFTATNATATGAGKFGSNSASIGTGYITTPSSSDWQFKSSDFTVESWVYVPDATYLANSAVIVGTHGTGSTDGWTVYLNTNGTATGWTTSSGGFGTGNHAVTSASPINYASWNHVAFVRNGNVLTIYLNGVGNSVTISNGYSVYNTPNSLRIGANVNNGNNFTKSGALIDEVRITKGVARYTTNFAPPQSAFPDTVKPDPYWANTSMLLRFDNSLSDVTGKHTITGSSTTYAGSLIGNTCLQINANGYISTPAHADFNFGAGDFTVEMWIWTPSTSALSQIPMLFCQYQSYNQPINATQVYFNPDGTIVGYITANGKHEVNADHIGVMSSAITFSEWNHVAFVRNGTKLQLYVNGNGQADGGSNVPVGYTAFSSNLPVTIGAYNSTGYHRFQATTYIDEVRVTKGVARYTSNFTPLKIPHAAV